jgi:sialidase-1
VRQTDVFIGGQDGYHTFRIPSIVATLEGTLLAFCEGRMWSSADKSPTDMVLKRSLDNGETWTAMQVVVKGVPDAIMDPCPVIDHTTGNIYLVYDRYPEGFKLNDAGWGLDSATAWVTHSTDNGQTWSAPRDITRTTKKRAWSQIAHGPGRGIQTRSGRLVIPCNSYDPSGQQRSFAIYSDDHGQTWQLGRETGPKMSESQVVELSDGSLMLNMRSYRGRGCRAMAISEDGGETWSDPIDVPELIGPVCQASIIRYETVDERGRGALLFSNPASHDRTRMTVKLSADEGNTWPAVRLIYAGPAAYSCLAVLPDGAIGCLYERGEDSPYEKITLARLSLEELTD